MTEPGSARHSRSIRIVGWSIAILIMAVAAGRALEPIFFDLSLYGGHDWDEISAQRLFTIKALRQHGEFPFWNPYACGGHSAWANVQGVPNLISPLLPAYWFFDVRWALRIELVSTVVASLLGSYLWAGHFTKSCALRAMVAVIYSLNGRWALQVQSGHIWHLYYALTPWIFWCFDRALSQVRKARTLWPELASRYLLLGGVLFALMVYQGAIYPLPHTAVLLCLYAAVLCIINRSPLPAVVLGSMGLLAFGLAAPKLLPELELMSRFPRLVASTEYVELKTLVAALTAPQQSMGSRPAPTPQWGWHEYGMYIGWLPFLAILVLFPLGCASSRSCARMRAARYAGLAGLLLGLGAFHEYAPWALLHELPLFSSQHVPSRWLYPALLLFCVVSAAAAERFAARLHERRWYAEVGFALLATYVAFDISYQAFGPIERTFWMKMRELPAPATEFHQLKQVPPELRYVRRDYAPEALPAMMTNRGVIDCTLMAALNVWADKDDRGRVIGIGAVGRDEPDYQGEVFVEGRGHASSRAWSPSQVVIEVTGAQAGSRLIYNQNYDPGWTAAGHTVENANNRVGVRLKQGSNTVRLTYRPPLWGVGLGVFALTLGGVLLCTTRRLRRRFVRH